MIKINIYKITDNLHSHLESFLNAVPLYVKEKLLTYFKAEDRLRSVIGKLILKKLLIEEGYPQNVLEHLRLDKYDRPFIDENIDFNIAHSGDYIICAISRDTRLGIDIEKIKDILIDDFNIGLREEELNEIKQHESPLHHFFSFWAQKEAVSKANGKGMEVILTDIILKNDSAKCENEEWNLTKLDIDDQYLSYIAFKGVNEIIRVKLELNDILEIIAPI